MDKKLNNIEIFIKGILYINIIVKPIKHLILILINFGILVNVIFSRLAQQLKIKNYKKKKLYYIRVAEGIFVI